MKKICPFLLAAIVLASFNVHADNTASTQPTPEDLVALAAAQQAAAEHQKAMNDAQNKTSQG